METPEAVVLPTLLARVATMSPHQQRLLLRIVPLVEADRSGSGTPAWLSALLDGAGAGAASPAAAAAAAALTSPPRRRDEAFRTW
jgi:hypothetical protein